MEYESDGDIDISTLGTVSNGLEKTVTASKIGERMETQQTTVLLRSARILKRVLENWKDLMSLRLCMKDHQ